MQMTCAFSCGGCPTEPAPGELEAAAADRVEGGDEVLGLRGGATRQDATLHPAFEMSGSNTARHRLRHHVGQLRYLIELAKRAGGQLQRQSSSEFPLDEERDITVMTQKALEATLERCAVEACSPPATRTVAAGMPPSVPPSAHAHAHTHTCARTHAHAHPCAHMRVLDRVGNLCACA